MASSCGRSGTTRRGGTLIGSIPGSRASLQGWQRAPIVPARLGRGIHFINTRRRGGRLPHPVLRFECRRVADRDIDDGLGLPNIVEGQAPDAGSQRHRRRCLWQAAIRVSDCRHADGTAPPTDIIATPAVLRAALAAGTTVSTLSAVDGNALDTHTFTLVAGGGRPTTQSSPSRQSIEGGGGARRRWHELQHSGARATTQTLHSKRA